jgi:hypothetical protein
MERAVSYGEAYLLLSLLPHQKKAGESSYDWSRQLHALALRAHAEMYCLLRDLIVDLHEELSRPILGCGVVRDERKEPPAHFEKT